MTRYYHYCASKTCLDKYTKDASKLHTGPKPDNGCLWLSVGYAWKKWLKDEKMKHMMSKYKHRKTIVLDDEFILWIKTVDDLVKFTSKYGYKDDIKWNKVMIDCRARGIRGVGVSKKVIDYARDQIWETNTSILWVLYFDIPSIALWDHTESLV